MARLPQESPPDTRETSRFRIAFFLIGLCFLPDAAFAESLEEALGALRAAGPAERQAAVERVLVLEPALDDVVEVLEAGVSVPHAAAGWHLLTAADAHGMKRPYQLYVPRSLPENETVPLLVYLHGGVSRPAFLTGLGEVGFGASWVPKAEAHGFVIVCPMGRTDTTWWNDAGTAHIRACIRAAKRRAPIDDDRIVASGFSDGGSGAFYLALADPDLFSGFLPMNGHPAVAARASGKPLYLKNLALRPLFVAMTQDDQLYPAKSVLPHLLAAIEADAAVTIVNYPSGGHSPVYWEEQQEVFSRFVTDTVRDALPQDFQWWCAAPSLGRVAWIKIDETGPAQGEAEPVADRNIESRPGRVLLGIGVDRAFAGSGVKVTEVQEGSVAASLGLSMDDVIVKMDGKEIEDLNSLRAALRAKRFGDDVSLEFRRGAATKKGATKIPPFRPAPVYLRTGHTAVVTARQRGNRVELRTNGVRVLRVFLSPGMFEFDQEVIVVVNGKEAARKKPVADLARLLTDYAREADSGRLFADEIRVVLPAAE